MVSGFLVRWDGALISIDDIIYIEMEQIFSTDVKTPQFKIMIHLREGHFLRWDRTSHPEPETRALLHELKELIKKAIEL